MEAEEASPTARRIEVAITGDSRSLERALGRSSAATRGFGSKFSKVGKIIGLAALGAGAAAATGIGFAVKAAAEYEQALNVFKAVSGATGDEMKRVGDLAKRLGADITLPGTSAKDAADAMTELAKGGLNVRESMAAAKGVLQLSAAAQIENAEAATITARALNSFALKGDQAVRVADLLAATANASTAEISDLAMGMSQASSVFKMGGQRIDDLTTALGLMANAGVAGSDAGTSLKTMMLSLLAPATDKAKNAIADLGVKLRDSQGRMLPLRDLIGQFSDKLGGLSDAQRDMALKTIFGTDALRAANIILAGGVKKWDAMKTATTKGGEAAELAQAKMKGFKGALEGFRSSLETLAISVGEKFLPLLTPAVGKLSEFVGFLDTLTSAESPTVALKIAFAGAKGAASNLVGALRDAVMGSTTRTPLKLDSGKIIEWETTRQEGLFNSIRDGLRRVDWTSVGRDIGEGISKRVRITADFIATALTAMNAFIDEHLDEFAELGAKMMLAVIRKLLDPGFWIRNWQLVLGIAVTVFPLGRLVKLGGAAAAALLRLFGKVLPAGFRSVGSRAVDAILGQLGRLPGSVQRVLVAVVSGAVGALGRLVGFLRGQVAGVLSRVPGWLKAAFRLSVFMAFVSGIQSGWAKVRAATVAAVAAVRGQISRISGPISTVVGWLNRVYSWLVTLTSRPWEIVIRIPRPSMPDIPFTDRFASGVQNFRGGMALVGERGPELVTLPRGANVIPNHRLRGGGMSPIDVHVALNVDGQTLLRVVRRAESDYDHRNGGG